MWSRIMSKEVNVSDAIYLDVVNLQNSLRSFWSTMIEINGKPIMFKLDKGAEVTVI